MHTSTYIKAAAGAIAAAGFMSQQVQCPPIAIPLITTAVALAARAGIEFAISVGGEVAKCKHGGCKRDLEAVSGIISARQVFTAPPGVPQFEFDRCATDLARVSLTVTGPIERNGIQVEGLPPTCMNLAGVLDGDAVGGGRPIPCGSACMTWVDMNDDQYNQMRSIFYQYKNA